MLRIGTVLLALCATTAHAELINDFENGLGGWSSVTSPGDPFPGSHGGISIVAAPGGGSELNISTGGNSTTSASRTINVSVPSELTFDYRISFFAPSWGFPEIGYFLLPTRADLMGEFYEHDPDDLPPNAPLPYDASHIVSGTKTILVEPGEFTMSATVMASFTMMTGGGGSTIYLDNISLTALPVPEPASFALALLAALGLLAMVRR